MKPKIGLALGSGGSRGIAHLGVIKSLLENNIPIDYLSGSSAGALIGAFYASWLDISKIEQLISNLDYRQYFSIIFDPASTPNSLIKGDKVSQFLKEQLGDVKIEDLKIPFTVVATNCLTAQPVVLNQGSLVEAVRASTSIPIIFSNPKIDGNFLMDGGNSLPIPVSVVKNMGADITIGVNVYTNLFPIKSANIATPLYAMLYNLSQTNLSTADIQVEPLLPMGANPLDFVKTSGYIRLGYEATNKIIPQIKKLIRRHSFPFF
jgi:NTE family protein